MIDEKIPYTYCWSPSLVPKPSDWPFYIDVSGFFFLDLATNYTTPPEDLLDFLGLTHQANDDAEKRSPPIFIGFGSITGHDSDRLLDVILKTLLRTGHRALLSGFDIDADRLPKTIFKIGDIPYDWLFQHGKRTGVTLWPIHLSPCSLCRMPSWRRGYNGRCSACGQAFDHSTILR